MREKLIELLKGAKFDRCYKRSNGEEITVRGYNFLEPELTELFADHLLSNGVIVLPCKVGDTVYRVEDVWHLDSREPYRYHYEKEVLTFEVKSILISCNAKGVWTKKFRCCQVRDGKTIDSQRDPAFDDIGKTVFLTREAAEAALKEVQG